MPWLQVIIAFIQQFWKPITLSLVVGLVFWGGWHARAVRCDASTTRLIKQYNDAAEIQRAKLQQKYDEAAKKLEKLLAAQRARDKKQREELSHEVQAHVIYRDCKPTADGLRILNETIANRDTPR